MLHVRQAGSVVGSGTIDASGALSMQISDGGSLNPGVNVIAPLLRVGQWQALRGNAVQPGNIVITGNPSISPSAAITIDVVDKTAFDKITVTGNVALSGTLVLNFGNGYAPKQGDTFAFIRGHGNTTLTANNNGVSTTPREQLVYLPALAW